MSDVSPHHATRRDSRVDHPPGLDDRASAQPDDRGAHLDYCRQSRRLRAKLSNDPVRLYRQLKHLSDKTSPDAAPKRTPERPLPPLAPPNACSAAGFAAHVAAQLTGPLLTYSQRLSLLRDAGRRSIARFEANLIIAAVQHRAEQFSKASASPAQRRTAAALVAALLLQSAIVLGCWWIGSR